MKKKGRDGFTLIEIMLVITIIGLLVSVAAPRFSGRSADAKLQVTRLQIENISMALEAFEFDCGRFPIADEGLSVLRTAPGFLANWKGPYMKKNIPVDAWGEPYLYLSPDSNNGEPAIFSKGPDRKEGTSDDIPTKEN